MSTKDNTVYILDSYGLIYRAYFALMNHPLTNAAGDNISAVVIFFNNLKALLDKYKVGYIAAAFDSRTKTFRHDLYPEYKANRAKTPEDLHAQVPVIEEILNALNVPVLRCDGFEADDIIALVAKKCAEEKRPCRILSGDKDLLQLVTENCKEMQPDKTSGGWETVGIEEVNAKWGIGPEKILDYLSLVGDTADNVPGVKGVGEKTALKLLGEYGCLDGIYEHAAEIKGALGEKIRGDKDNAYFSKKLIELCTDLPVEINFEDFTTDNLDYKKAAEKLDYYGAKKTSKAYASMGSAKSDGNTEVASAENSDTTEAESEESENSIIQVMQNKGSYKAVTKLSDLENFVNEILADEKKVFAFDTETTGLNTHSDDLVGFSLCHKKGEGIYVPVILAGGMFAPETISKKDCLVQLERLFQNEELTAVLHNAKFDLEILYSNGMNKKAKCKIFDTMIAAWLLNPGENGKSPFALETLGEKLLGLKGIEFKDLVQKGQTFIDVPLEKAADYGAEDSDFTYQLYEILSVKIVEKKLGDLFYNMEMKVLPILVDMEREGIYLDVLTLNEFSLELKKLIDEKEAEIYKEAGHEFNISSPKQLQTVLFEERGLPHGKKTKTGYSTDESVLEELAQTTFDTLPALILEYRSYAKLFSTYVEALPKLCDKNSKIHTSFMQTGTATGRLSSKDPNLQNIPIRDENGRRIRSAFKAANGNVLISADYAQIELVVLAHLSGDKNLSQSFIDGIDVHKSTAALIYNIKAEDVTAQQRRFAKTVNFGVMYGMSAFRLAKDLDISRTEAKNFIDKYFETYADVKRFLDQTIVDAKANGYVETVTGRRRYIPEIKNSNKLIQQGAERVAVNTPIQGTAADIVKTAMIKVVSKLAEEKINAKLLLQVHDELIFECSENEAEKAVEIIRSEMEGAFKLNVPLRVSIESGKSWGEFH
ncbi:MAG: DNA polymerase I [Treponema sp.]|nr:DNA polymerase I [Treponema sp.]